MEHIDVVMSYCRHNVYDTTLARDLPFYKNNNIGVINASPLGELASNLIYCISHYCSY